MIKQKKNLENIPNNGKFSSPGDIPQDIKEGIRKLQGPGDREKLLSAYSEEDKKKILRGLRMMYTRSTDAARRAVIGNISRGTSNE